MMLLRRVVPKFKPLASSSRFFSSNDNSHDLLKSIAELNQEMEFVFGEPPTTDVSNTSLAQESEPVIINDMQRHGLTHIGSKGEAQMVDISSKEITERVAIASCRVILGRNGFDLVSTNQMKKGDVLAVAKIAGVCGAKQTSNLIPLCHNINLTNVRVDLTLNPSDLSIEIEGEASSMGKTGVEMEALTAVTIAGLTVYDMCKSASKHIVITDVQLQSKSGGKTGDWSKYK